MINQKASKTSLSIVLPTFNEFKNIKPLINKILSYSDQLLLEIIVVDDCSTDGTRELLKNLNDDTIKVFYHDFNQGKGAALRTGFKSATGDICIVQDADLEYDPKEFPLLLDPIIKNKADVVFGRRIQSGRPHRVVYFWHRIGNGVLT